MATPDKHAALLGKLLEKIDIAMLTTVGPNGYLVSRPLSTQQATFDGERVWFFTEADSPKIDEIRRHAKVNLAYASKDKNTYISLAGDARISRDQAKIDELWSDAMKAFFPKGRDDPNLVLLEVAVRTAEYWDGPGTMLGKLLTFMVARVTGQEEIMADNRILDLTGARTTSRLPPSNKAARGAGTSAAAARKPLQKAAGKSTRKTTKQAATSPAKPADGATARKSASKSARTSSKSAARRAPQGVGKTAKTSAKTTVSGTAKKAAKKSAKKTAKKTAR